MEQSICTICDISCKELLYCSTGGRHLGQYFVDMCNSRVLLVASAQPGHAKNGKKFNRVRLHADLFEEMCILPYSPVQYSTPVLLVLLQRPLMWDGW